MCESHEFRAVGSLLIVTKRGCCWLWHEREMVFLHRCGGVEQYGVQIWWKCGVRKPGTQRREQRCFPTVDAI